ncbi:MAG: hypothetical protein AB7Q16_02105 [Vicinamibacterales bacterium]
MDAPVSPLARRAGSPWAALGLFFGLAVVATWPLLPGLGKDVPGDYGDPLFVAWAMAWVAHRLGGALTGDLDALLGFWDANQLHPEPGTLALSDHFIAQAVPLAPVYWLTGNPLLVLGLAYLAAYVLCGFCTWLLVREVTGSAAAGVLAGCTFAFNPFFLVWELSHLQVISAWGMPLALYGLRRYFERGSRAGLWTGAAGIVLLNLSAGYYMLMFPMFVLLYAGWEITSRGWWGRARMWRDLLAAGTGAILATAPFVWPYAQAQRRLGFARSVDETTQMAAAVEGYIAGMEPLIIPFAFAGLALMAAAVMRMGRARRSMPLLGFATAGATLAFWLSLGPAPSWGGEVYPALGLYGLLQEHVPGMDALRVTSRFGIVFLLFLGVLAGMGGALVARLPMAAPLVAALGVWSMLMNAPVSFPLNQPLAPTLDVRPPAPYLTPGGAPPDVYRYLSSLPSSTVVAELPFTDLWYNTRYLYFSTFHWHPLVNGFTSFFPPAYTERARWLVNPVRTPDEAWRALESGQATHVVVHTDAWDAAYVQELDRWLTTRGALSHGDFGGARVYQVPPPRAR